MTPSVLDSIQALLVGEVAFLLIVFLCSWRNFLHFLLTAVPLVIFMRMPNIVICRLTKDPHRPFEGLGVGCCCPLRAYWLLLDCRQAHRVLSSAPPCWGFLQWAILVYLVLPFTFANLYELSYAKLFWWRHRWRKTLTARACLLLLALLVSLAFPEVWPDVVLLDPLLAVSGWTCWI